MSPPKNVLRRVGLRRKEQEILMAIKDKNIIQECLARFKGGLREKRTKIFSVPILKLSLNYNFQSTDQKFPSPRFLPIIQCPLLFTFAMQNLKGPHVYLLVH